MSIFKRGMCLILSLGLVLGLAACGGGGDIATVSLSPDTEAVARGRYVEEELELPSGKYIGDMVLLKDGRLRVSVFQERGAVLCTTGPDRTDWVETTQIPEEILAGGDLSHVILSPDGTVFCDTARQFEGEACEFRFWVIDPEGSFRELPVAYPELDETASYLITYCDFTDSGKLMVQFYFTDVREVDLTTGALGDNINELEKSVSDTRCAGESTYMIGHGGSVSVYRDGETTVLEGPMGEQLAQSLKATDGYSPKLTFWQDPQGYQIFTTHDGLYSYIPGGSITEELVSGARTNLGDPSFFPEALAGADDRSFYVLGSRHSDGHSTLYHYVYDPDMPTQSETQMRLYTLYADEALQQMVSQYQTAHPDVSIDLEVGLTGEDGVTAADAIRTLNTKILAGDGPDIIRLDGLRMESYMEKGLLADLGGILAKAEPTLEQVSRCYESGGRVCALPTAFALPAVYGPKAVVDQADSWEALVAATEQARADRPDANGVLAAWLPMQTADQFYDSCSPAWQNPDGSLNREKLTQFYGGLQKIFALDAPLRERMAVRVQQQLAADDYIPGDYTGILGSLAIVMGGYCAGFGTLESMWSLSYALAADSDLEGYEAGPLTLGGEGVFLPRRIMGILADSENLQAAEDFLTFMLSEEVQSGAQDGFPVNRAVSEKELSEDREMTDAFTSSDEEGNMVTYHLRWPDGETRRHLQAWIDGLTTPALTDRTIRNMVMDQVNPCLLGEITPEEAAGAAVQALNLYLAE